MAAVLIIEDETVLAKNIRLYLERVGHEARTADNGADGLREFDTFKPDVVLLDYQLPGITGLEVLAALRQRDAGVHVVMLTGQGSVELAVEAMKRGAADFLTKPVVLAKLRLLIDKLLGEARAAQALSYYREREGRDSGVGRLIGESTPMQSLKGTLRRLIEAEAALGDDEPPAVLVTGETGTGKELVARALHFEGRRRSAPFIELNCGSVPAHLLESELFGHERGAFTDARERKIGLVEAADGGTLFLDEIGDMDLALQVKLLKVIEDRRVRRLGSVREQRVNLRIIAATHQPLEQLVQERKFRADLYFRLRIIQLSLPPLRERGEDVLLLAEHFLRQQARRYHKTGLRLDDSARRALLAHSWPGNVRELCNVIEQTVLLAPGPVIGASHLQLVSLPATPQSGLAGQPPDPALKLSEAEQALLLQALERSRWNVTQAARLLGVSRDTLRYRMEKYRLSRDS